MNPQPNPIWPWPEATVFGGGAVRPLASTEAAGACPSCDPAPRAEEALAASPLPASDAIEVHRGGMAVGITLRAGALRDLAASHVRLGDYADGQRDHASALQHYRIAATIMQGLAIAYPDNVAIFRDLSVSWNRIAAMLAALGDHTGAADHYRRSLALIQRLLLSAPEHPDLQRDLAWCRARLVQRL